MHNIWTVEEWSELDGYLRATKEMCATAIERVRADLAQGFIYMTWVQPVNMTAYSGLEVTLKSFLLNGLGVDKNPRQWGHRLSLLLKDVDARQPVVVQILREAYESWIGTATDRHPSASFMHDGKSFHVFIKDLEGYFDAFRYWPLDRDDYQRLKDRPIDPRLLVALWDALFYSCEEVDKGRIPSVGGWREHNIIINGLDRPPLFLDRERKPGTPVHALMRKCCKQIDTYRATGLPSALRDAVRIRTDLEQLAAGGR